MAATSNSTKHASTRTDSLVELWNDLSADLWDVQLFGGATRLTTTAELVAAFARQEVDADAVLRRHGGSLWMTLRESGVVDPSKREPFCSVVSVLESAAPKLAAPLDAPSAAARSGMPVANASTEEIASALPSSRLGKLVALASVGLVGAGVVVAMSGAAPSAPAVTLGARASAAAIGNGPSDASPASRPATILAATASSDATAHGVVLAPAHADPPSIHDSAAHGAAASPVSNAASAASVDRPHAPTSPVASKSTVTPGRERSRSTPIARSPHASSVGAQRGHAPAPRKNAPLVAAKATAARPSSAARPATTVAPPKPAHAGHSAKPAHEARATSSDHGRRK